MTLIAEIKELAACAAWSPFQEHRDWIVTGTKVSSRCKREEGEEEEERVRDGVP